MNSNTLITQELLAAQLVPTFPKLWEAGGYTEAPIDFTNISYPSMRRMAGNSFNQAAATTFIAFILSQLVCVK